MPNRKPAYTLHKSTGQARVRINGKDFYLGEYGSPKSRDRYDDLVAEWFARNGDTSRYTLTVDDLCILFMQHAERYYRKNGEPTCEVCNIRVALRPLIELFGPTRIRDFGPVKLKQVCQKMIEAGCVRTSINRQVGRIKRMFRWGVENEHVPAAILTALSAVNGLRKGRSEAIESKPVTPVPQAFVDAIEPCVTRQVWGMIRVQLLCGMRPVEVTLLRGCDINMVGRIWEYVPASHKTEHHGRSRIVFIGPRAQEVVREFLKPNLEAYLFSPADARDESDAKRRANRKSPMTPSQRARGRKQNPEKQPGDRYTTKSYGYAIRNACKMAEVPNWSPNQLRHNAATLVRREFGIEATRTVLGHASAVTSEIYAEMDHAKARDIVAKIG